MGFRILEVLRGVLAGVALLGLVAGAEAGEPERPVYVHLTSECLTGGVLASEIRSYVTWPEPVKREHGEQYVLNLSTPNGVYQHCWQDKAARDAALAQVRQALGPQP